MKKLLFALAICSLVVFALVTTVMADNGPHGSFAADTSACAGCHRVHTASYGSNALLVADPEALCEACHAGFGAGTNVANGVYTGNSEGVNGGSLMGGGFENALMATKWSGNVTFNAAFNAVSKPTTSHHDLGTSGTVWGSGANNSTPGTYVLECTSCHDPHGSAGWSVYNAIVPNKPSTTTIARVPSYRLLRWQPNGSNGFTFNNGGWPTVNWSGGSFPSSTGVVTSTTNTGWWVPDNFLGAEWYTIGTTGAFAVGDYSAPSNANNVYQPTGFNYIPAAVNTAFFCAQCHDRYFNNSRLRNNTDISAYCNGGNPATIPPPAGPASVSPIDPVYCIPAPSGAAWVWGDNRPSGDTTYMYRHASGDIRLSQDGTASAGAGTSISRSCMACHVAHGTTAVADSLSANATLSHDSALLRMDNRSICLRCHAGDVNFTVGP